MKRHSKLRILSLLVIVFLFTSAGAASREASVHPKAWVDCFEGLMARHAPVDGWVSNVATRPSTQREGEWIHADCTRQGIQVVLAGSSEETCDFASVIFFPESEAVSDSQAELHNFLSTCASSITASLLGGDDTWDAAFSMIESAMADFADDNSQLTQRMTFEGLGISLQHGLSGEPYHGILVELGANGAQEILSQPEEFVLRMKSIYVHYGFELAELAPEAVPDSLTELMHFTLPDAMFGRLAVLNDEIRAIFLYASYAGMDSAERDACVQALYDHAMRALSAASDVSAFEISLIRAQLHALGNGFADGTEKSWKLTDWSLLLTPIPEESLYLVTLFKR